MQAIKKRKKGFTLIEMIMAIVLAGVVAGIIGGVINQGMNSWLFIKGQKSISADSNSVSQRMVREIRKTKSASSIEVFTSTRYKFVDIDENTIDYKKNGSNLERNGAVMLSNLASNGLEFIYLNGSGETTSITSEIRTVQITVIEQDRKNYVRLMSAASIRSR